MFSDNYRRHIAVMTVMLSAMFSSAAFGQTGTAEFTGTFSDQNGTTVREMAAYEGISEAAALARLQNMTSAAATAYTAGTDHGQEISGVDITYASGIATARSFGSGGEFISQNGKQANRLRYAASNLLEAIPSKKSIDDIVDIAIRESKKFNIDVYAEIDYRTGKVELIVPDINAFKSLISSRSIGISDKITVKEGSPIVKTQAIISWGGGTRLNMLRNLCTAGWPAKYFDQRTVLNGNLTATHCQDEGMLDATNPSYYFPSATATRVSRVEAARLQDIQFMKFVNQNTNRVIPIFNDGSGRGQPIKGYTYAATNMFICKYGRQTGRTCGYVGYDTYRNSEGTFYKMISKNATPQNPLVKSTDSGGPVFAGNLVIGITYGMDRQGNMYFSPAHLFRAYLPKVSILCSC